MDKCIYCGAKAECREHVIPVSFLSNIRSYEPDKNWIVDSCNICNILAGSKIFFSIPDKASYILKRFKAKYKKVLKIPEWTDDELQDMSYQMKSMITGGLVAKRVAFERVRFIQSISEYPKDFLMPDFVKSKILEWRREYYKLKRKNRKKKLSTLLISESIK